MSFKRPIQGSKSAPDQIDELRDEIDNLSPREYKEEDFNVEHVLSNLHTSTDSNLHNQDELVILPDDQNILSSSSASISSLEFIQNEFISQRDHYQNSLHSFEMVDNWNTNGEIRLILNNRYVDRSVSLLSISDESISQDSALNYLTPLLMSLTSSQLMKVKALAEYLLPTLKTARKHEKYDIFPKYNNIPSIFTEKDYDTLLTYDIT